MQWDNETAVDFEMNITCDCGGKIKMQSWRNFPYRQWCVCQGCSRRYTVKVSKPAKKEKIHPDN